jgi:hypothetical protein
MSEPVNLLLHAPSEAELVAALDRASSRAGSELRGSERWRVVLDEIAGNDDGRSQLEHSRPDDFGSRYVSAAWWTDHRGTKHVRISGGDTGSAGWHPHYSGLDHDIRPALWHVFMERVYRVTRPGEEARWLVSCACGETGEARELGWMGERCAACHDRREEGQPHPDDARPVMLVGPDRGHGLAFSNDGRLLAVSSDGWFTRLLDVGSGEERVLAEYDTEGREEYYAPLAFSPDGRWLAGGVSGAWAVNFWDLSGEEGESDLRPPGYGESVRSLAFSPDGRLFAAHSDEQAFYLSTADGDQVIISADGLTDGQLPCRCSSFAFSADGRTLAQGFALGLVYLHDTQTWGNPRQVNFESDQSDQILFVQFTTGRRLVAITGGFSEAVPHQLRLWDLERSRERPAIPIPRLTRVVARSPDGRYLASVVHDEQHSPGEILFWDVERWADGGRLEWNPEDAINDLAFSPDGQTLATISQAGVVKLWPWRLLLG